MPNLPYFFNPKYVSLLLLGIVISHIELAAQIDSKQLGSLSLRLIEEPNSSISLSGSEQAVILIEMGPLLNQRIAEQAIKYASPARIWLSKSLFDTEQSYFYVNGAISRFDFVPQTNKEQRLIISGLADFSSIQQSFSFNQGRVYRLTVEIQKAPENDLPSMQEAMDPTTSIFLNEEMGFDQSDVSNDDSKKGFFRFAWAKSAVRNKYVRWGAAAVALSAGGYFGYQLIGNESSGPNLPLPPAPPQ